MNFQINILLDPKTSDARRKQIAWDLNSDLENSAYFKDFYLLKQKEQPPSPAQILIFIGFFLAIVAIITAASFGFYKIRLLKQKKFNQKILEIQEEERLRISNELHDTIAQNLKSIQMESENQKNQPVSKLASDSINQIRALCYNLMPPDFNIDNAESKLENLLDFLCKDLTSKGFACHFFSDEKIPKIEDKNVLLNIFRIVQEALNNAQTHSQATNCSILVKNKESSIIIFVTDNGIGIPERILKNGKQNHYGIHSMRSRAEIIGAKLDIKSEENDGTEIRLEIKI
ncbi:MAG: sensor histidine kinase [Treponema sp.]|nr:sensor histidine kinase [Candidatus Treponema equifaecale]